jgi:hypothetical protein
MTADIARIDRIALHRARALVLRPIDRGVEQRTAEPVPADHWLAGSHQNMHQQPVLAPAGPTSVHISAACSGSIEPPSDLPPHHDTVAR